MLSALALALGLLVAPPDWAAPEPGAFPEAMAVTGVVRVDGSELSSPSDLVAAFVDGEVRGVTGSSLVGGRRVFFLSVAGAAGDGVVAFKAYDAEADRVLDVIPDVTFDGDAPAGTVSAPLVWTPLTGEAPAWNVDPADFDGSMTVTATVVEADGAPVGEGAVVAAFLGTEVRGVAEVEDVGSFGALAFLSVFGDNGEDGLVTFRVYRPGPARTFATLEAVAIDVGGGVGSLGSPLTLTLTAGVTLNGGEGWRMLAPPGLDASVGYLLEPLWTQGFAGADVSGGSANVYRYDETAGAYDVADDASDVWARGTGRFVHVFADDDVRTPTVDGGFPKTLPAVGVGPSGGFTFSLTRTEGNGEPEGPGWNLLGNPFAEAVDWDAGWTRSDVSESVYVWDPGHLGGTYRVWNGTVGSLDGGVLPAGNAFWVEALGPSPEVAAPATAKVGDVAVYGRQPPRGAGTCCAVTLAVSSEDRPGLGAEAFVSFQDDARAPGPEADPYDAWALTPPASDYLLIGSAASEGERLLAIDARPPLASGPLEIPVDVRVVEAGAPRAGAVRLSWPRVDLPAGWAAALVDAETGAEVALVPGGSLALTTAAPARVHADASGPSLRVARGRGGRLALRLSPPPVSVDLGARGGLSVSGPWPNPTRGQSTLRLTAPTAQRVRAVVLDPLGRTVAVVFDGVVAGTAEVPVYTSGLAPGAYLVRVDGAGSTDTRGVVVAR